MAANPVGNLADLKEGEVLLPSFILRRSGGVFVDMAHFPGGEGFEQFVERLFTSGAYFADLDYGAFLRLLYDDIPAGERRKAGGGSVEMRLARDIARFLPRRRELYKGVKVLGDGEAAEYMFEPVALEEVSEEPIYGQADEDGLRPITGYATKTVTIPTKLDFDEFVADMWQKGVRFGIDAEGVRRIVERGEMVRAVIARQLEPTLGKDAYVREETKALYRDDAPKRLPDGRVDLRQFANRFPQITQDERLLKKMPRILGKPGRKVSGQIVEPPIPLDIDLAPLSGPGTRVEQGADGEFIVAAQDGFILLDTASNVISVTEKIESREDVSIKTTGDLSLDVEEFVAHGEVQEGRVVEGRHMTFRSDVYGTVLSQGGNILIGGGLSGGKAQSRGGNVAVQGLSFNSVIEAWDGEVTLGSVQGCAVFGRKVTAEKAVSCEIVAEEVELASAEGCAIVGKAIHIGVSDTRRDDETFVTALVPDLSGYDGRKARMEEEIAEIRQTIQAKREEAAKTKAEPELAKFLALEGKIREGAIKLTPAQAENWEKARDRFAMALLRVQKMEGDLGRLEDDIRIREREIVRVLEERKAVGTGIRCVIDEVKGETVVRMMASPIGMLLFHGVPAAELKTKLRGYGNAQDRVFAASSGRVDWRYQAPEEGGQG